MENLQVFVNFTRSKGGKARKKIYCIDFCQFLLKQKTNTLNEKNSSTNKMKIKFLVASFALLFLVLCKRLFFIKERFFIRLRLRYTLHTSFFIRQRTQCVKFFTAIDYVFLLRISRKHLGCYRPEDRLNQYGFEKQFPDCLLKLLNRV